MSTIVHKPWCTDHQHDDTDGGASSAPWDSCETRMDTEQVKVGVYVTDGGVTAVDLYAQPDIALTAQGARDVATALVRAAGIVEGRSTSAPDTESLLTDRADEPYERQDDCPSWCRAHLYENGSFGEPVTLHRAVIAHGELDDHVAINQGIGMTWGNSGVSANQPTLEVEGFIWVDAAGTRDLISALQTGLRLLEADS